VTRSLLALSCAALAMGTSIAASGITARSYAEAELLHKLQRECELRAASIEAKTIKVRGFTVDGRQSEGADDETNSVQVDGVVSGSLNLGGSHAVGSDVSKVSLSRPRYTP